MNMDHKYTLYMYVLVRYYLNKMDMKRCSRETEERDVCMAKDIDCEKALATKNFTGQT